MTVRVWVTISLVVLALLSAAVAVKVLSPLRAPALVASAGRSRLEGVYRGSCWTQRGGGLRCEKGAGARVTGPVLPRSGVLRIVAAFPVQPEDGTLRIEGAGVLAAWSDRLPYELEPGRYVLRADARYSKRDYVRYDFPFRVR